MSAVSAPSLAAASASSLPSIPMWALTYSSLVLIVRSATAFSASTVLSTAFDRISLESKASIAAWESQRILRYETLFVLQYVIMNSMALYIAIISA